MAGGIAILLLVIVAVVAAVAGLSLYLTGGFLWWRKTDPRADRIEGDREHDRRPRHTRPTTPAQQRTDFVGTHDED
jgi:uncharacterized iron-regulated membrane protein